MGFPNPYELHESGGENTILSLTIKTQNEHQKNFICTGFRITS